MIDIPDYKLSPPEGCGNLECSKCYDQTPEILTLFRVTLEIEIEAEDEETLLRDITDHLRKARSGAIKKIERV